MSVFVIAEAGSNWYNGEESEAQRLTRAHVLTDVAAEAGASAIKWQVFTADSLYKPEAAAFWVAVRNLEMPLHWLPVLAKHAHSLGLEFMASAFSPALVDVVDPFVKRHKVASLEITDHTLLRHIASKGKPVIFSVGAATWEEARAASEILTEEVDVTMMHCVTAYPCPPDDANVSFVKFIAEWGYEEGTGFSDHTEDPVVGPVMAVAYGAKVIEKHFTLSRGLSGPDHHYGIEPSGLKDMVRSIRLAERMVGTGKKDIQPSEAAWRNWQRKNGGVRELRATS